ncbi:MAG: hypothetical protein ACUVQF_06460 [Fervidobacterium sp.]|uniref:hypothetical protein n=1 Tax=Fervidobacterium sp. TaxID=1871331 RepID=UPI00404A3687
MQVPNKKERQLNSKTIKDMILLLLGAFGLGTMLPTYIYSVAYFLNLYPLPKTLLVAIFYSEILMFIFLRPHLTLLLELTRTAIGRRTPYLIVFGVLTAFLLTVVYSLLEIENSSSAVIFLFLILFFNFSAYVYTLALLGLFSDKRNYNYDDILKSQSKVWFIIGALLSYLYSINTYKQRETVSYPAMFFFLSAFAVAFLIVEDKKYKVKLSPTEKTQIYESVKRSFEKPHIEDFKNALFQDSKTVLAFLSVYAFQYLLPLYVFFKTQDIFASAFSLFYFFIGSIFGVIIKKFLSNLSSIFESLKLIFLAFSSILLVSIYFTYNLSLIYLIVFFTSMFLEILFSSLERQGLNSIPLFLSTDRFYFMERTSNRFNIFNALLLYISIVLTGILVDIFGSGASGVILIAIVLSNIIALNYPRVKIENKEKEKE